MNVRFDASRLLGSKSNLVSFARPELDLRRDFLRHVRVEIFDCHFLSPLEHPGSNPFRTYAVPV